MIANANSIFQVWIGQGIFMMSNENEPSLEEIHKIWKDKLIREVASSPDDREYYSEGMCHAFAIGILENNPSFRLHIVLSKNDTYVIDDGEEVPSIIHVYALNPLNNLAYDIFGVRNKDDIIEECLHRYCDDVYPSWMDKPHELDEMISKTTEDGDYIDMPLSEISQDDIFTACEISKKLFPEILPQPLNNKRNIKSAEPGL